MTALCCVAHADILIFFYLCICLFIDEEEGNALAESCAGPLKLILLQHMYQASVSTRPCRSAHERGTPAKLKRPPTPPPFARVATFSDLKSELDFRPPF